MKILFYCTLVMMLGSSVELFSKTIDTITLKIGRIIIDIPEGKPIVNWKNYRIKESVATEPEQYYYENFRIVNSFYPENIKEVIEKSISNKGINIKGKSSLFAELESNEEPKLALGARITEFRIYHNSNYTKLSITNSIEWQILDLESNQIVYNNNIQTEYLFESSSLDNWNNKNNFSKFIISSIDSSVNKLLNDSIISLIFSNKKKKDDYVIDTSSITIKKISPFDSSKWLDKSISGTITIKTPSGLGSGFFINDSGLILTCYHVIKQSSKIEVFLNQGISMVATVVKINPEYDVAVLKLDNINSVPLALGIETNNEIGSDIFSIGTPTSAILSQSVSRGIISGYRTIDGKELLQTDASVSPGNSGGPLLNSKGEVIGITNAKIVSRGSEGIAFGIPIKIALEKLNIQIEP